MLAESVTAEDLFAEVDEGGETTPVTSGAKMLLLLDAFKGPQMVLGVTELATRASLSKSTTHRLLGTLVSYGYVRRVGDRYCLSDRLFELAASAALFHPRGIRERSAPYLAEAFLYTRQTVHLGVLRGSEVLYVDKICGKGSARLPTRVGQRNPAHCTALGKAMMAHSRRQDIESWWDGKIQRFTPYTLVEPGRLSNNLDRVRSEGFALDAEEFRLGLTCLAVPVLHPQTKFPLAAISVSSTPGGPDVRRFAAELRKISESLARALA